MTIFGVYFVSTAEGTTQLGFGRSSGGDYIFFGFFLFFPRIIVSKQARIAAKNKNQGFKSAAV